MKWTKQSKRLLIVLLVNAVWIATLSVDKELFRFLTPQVLGFDSLYMGFETYRPSGVNRDREVGREEE